MAKEVHRWRVSNRLTFDYRHAVLRARNFANPPDGSARVVVEDGQENRRVLIQCEDIVGRIERLGCRLLERNDRWGFGHGGGGNDGRDRCGRGRYGGGRAGSCLNRDLGRTRKVCQPPPGASDGLEVAQANPQEG